MRRQPELQEPLHAPTRNRQLTIASTFAVRLKPLQDDLCACILVLLKPSTTQWFQKLVQKPLASCASLLRIWEQCDLKRKPSAEMPSLSKGRAAEERRIKAAQEADRAPQSQDGEATKEISDSSDSPSCSLCTDTDSDEERDHMRACVLQGRALSQKRTVRIDLNNAEVYCQGLFSAIHDMSVCKEVFTKASPTEILLILVGASSCSHFCLSHLKHDMPRLVNAIETVEHHLLSHFDPIAIFAAWSARSLLTGYQQIPPCYKSNLPRHLQPTVWVLKLVEGHEQYEALLWAANCGLFKLYWHSFASHNTGMEAVYNASQREPLQPYVPATRYSTAAEGMISHARLMFRQRPRHPASLQAMQMCRRALCEEGNMAAAREAGTITAATDSNQQPKHALTEDEMRDDRTLLWRGFQAAMLMYKDPALAMQHLLYCMMRELLDCRGDPDDSVRSRLRWSADNIMSVQHILTHTELCSNILWDVVRDGLVPAMALLAHTFDMRKMLPDQHPLPKLIKQQTAEWQERCETEAKDGSETSASSNNHCDCEEHETCSCCGNIRLKAIMKECMQCNRAIYCSVQCMIRHNAQHKGPCKRYQLGVKARQQIRK